MTIFPRTEEELYSLEQMDDIDISYLPFCYIMTKDHSNDNNVDIILPENPHKITYHQVQSSDGETIEEQIISLPVLYAVWPIGKTIPVGMDYHIDYEVFLPKHSISTKSMVSLTKRDLTILERAAIALANGKEIPETKVLEDPDSMYYRYIGGYIKCHESITNTDVALGKLNMRFQIGTNIVSSTTLPDGYFYFSCEIPDGANLSCSLNNSTWRIISGNVDTPLQYPICTLESLMQEDYNISLDNEILLDIPRQAKYAQFATNYFYYGSHGIVTPRYANPIKISLTSDDGQNIAGLTRFPDGVPLIILYNPNQTDYWLLCTVFHELGHASHYYEIGDSTQYNFVEQRLKESFANYVGWHCTRCFYSLHGYNSSFTDVGYQAWLPNSGSDYTPFFIDLVDTLNQSIYDSRYLNDNISGVSHATIHSLITSCSSISECIAALRDLIGTCYTEADFNAYVSSYLKCLNFIIFVYICQQ